MRSQTIGGITTEYPEYAVYSGDFNYVSMSATDSDNNVLAVTVGGQRAEYSSDAERLTVEVGSLLRRNGTFGVVSLSIYVSRSNPAYSTTISVDVLFLHGRTLPSRYHGSGRRVIVPIGQPSVQIPVIDAATVYRDGTQVATTTNAQIVDVAVSSTTHNIEVKYSRAGTFGDWHYCELAQSVYFTTYQPECTRENEIVLQWYDTDGCKRFAVGKLLNRRQASEGVEYASGGSLVQHPADRIITSVSEVLTVVFPIRTDEYFAELALSDEVAIINNVSGAEMPVIIDGDIETTIDKAMDITLKIKTLI